MSGRTPYLVFLLCFLVARASVAADAPSMRVFRPQLANLLERAVASAGLDLKSGKVAERTASLQVCADACSEVGLTDPLAGCGGEQVGPFCASWPALPPAARDALRPRLAAIAEDAAWQVPATNEWQRQPWERAIGAPLWAIATLLIPWSLGWTTALAIRRRRARWEGLWLGLGLLVLPPSIAAAVGIATLRWGLWDLVGLGAGVGIGLLHGGHVWGSGVKRWAALAVSASIALVTAEFSVRTMLPPPPSFPDPELASIRLPDREVRLAGGLQDSVSAAAACSLLFPKDQDPLPALLAGHPAARTRWLHVGDSMLYGSGVSAPSRYTALLQAARPWEAHWNAGTPGTSLDVQWLVVQRALRLSRPDTVAVHLFVSNDFDEIDRPYPCCAAGPLLNWPDGQPPVPRCTTAEWKPAVPLWLWYMLRSPLPYALRVATAQSQLAGHLVARHVRLVEPPIARSQGVARYIALLRWMHAELAAQGIALRLVALPIRGPLDPEQHEGTTTVLQAAQALHIPVLDCHQAFMQAVATHGEPALFVASTPGDPHFSELGHQVMAKCLAQWE